MNSDLTFITNEAGQTFRDRFEILIKDSRFFDCLVGYQIDFCNLMNIDLSKAIEEKQKNAIKYPKELVKEKA